MKDGRPFMFTGLWEGWKPPETEDWIRTCTFITGEPNELIRQIHTRMRVILPENQLDACYAVKPGERDTGAVSGERNDGPGRSVYNEQSED
jgi:putative SOS response-associated peptidase YedK